MATLSAIFQLWREAGTKEVVRRVNRRLGLAAAPGRRTGRTCPRPFMYASVQANGRVHCCCPTWLRLSLGQLGPGRDLWQIWNSRPARMFRRAMHETKLDAVCLSDTCPYIIRDDLPRLDAKGLSVAQGQGRELFGSLEDCAQLREAMEGGATRLDYPPMRIDIDADRRCNLACRSCRKGHVTKLSEKEQGFLDELGEVIIRMGPELREMNLLGDGEAFFSPFALGLLRTLSKETHPNLAIHVITNGQLLTPRLWDSLEPGRELITSLSFSIDAAAGETYEEVRRGASWKRLLKALEFAKQLRERGEINALSTNFVVTSRNFREMPAFVRLSRQYGVDYIVFTPLLAWNDMEYSYREAAVHLPRHPQNPELLEVLRDPLLAGEDVRLSLDVEPVTS